MGLFDKDDRKKILDNGGRLERNGTDPRSDADMDSAAALVRAIGKKEQTGFYFVIRVDKAQESEKEGHEGHQHREAEGIITINGVDKSRVLDIVLKSLNLTPVEIKKYLMLRTLMSRNED